MAAKVFILGRPGSGKSTAAYYIAGVVWRKGWSVSRFKDYDILYRMFKADIEGKKFRPTTRYDGFDVIDFSVLDAALKELNRRFEERISSARKNDLIIIEFARDDYSKALKLFSQGLIEDAYFLFIEANVKNCIRRIRVRAAHPLTADDFFVSKKILQNYYNKDNREYITSRLKADFSIANQIEIIDNTGSMKEFLEKVRRFAERVLEQEI